MKDIRKLQPIINRVLSSDLDRFAILMFGDLFGVLPLKQNSELRDRRERRIVKGLHTNLLTTMVKVTMTEMTGFPRRPRGEAGRQIRFRREVLPKL